MNSLTARPVNYLSDLHRDVVDDLPVAERDLECEVRRAPLLCQLHLQRRRARRLQRRQVLEKIAF